HDVLFFDDKQRQFRRPDRRFQSLARLFGHSVFSLCSGAAPAEAGQSHNRQRPTPISQPVPQHFGQSPASSLATTSSHHFRQYAVSLSSPVIPRPSLPRSRTPARRS